MKKLIATIAIMLLGIAAYAQQHTTENTLTLSGAKPHSITEATIAPSFFSPVSLQVLVGSQGIGADIKYGFLPNLSGRLGFGIIPVEANRGFHFSALPVNGRLSTGFSNLHLLADYSPFKSKGFRIVGGAAYLIRGNAQVMVSPADGYNIGNHSLTSDQIGELYADVTWKGIAPYLGFSLFRGFPNRLFNVNLDVGTYYLSSPGTSFIGTKLLENNDANASQFHENMQGYRWLPVVQLNFNFRLK